MLQSVLTVAWFFSTNHNSLLCTVTNEVASFCIDNRSHQMAFFCLRQSGQRRGKGRLSRYVEIFWNKKGFLLLYKANRFHVAVRLFSNRSQKTSNRVCTHLESPWKSLNLKIKFQGLESPWKVHPGPWKTLKFAVWLFSLSGRTTKDWELNKSGSYPLDLII